MGDMSDVLGFDQIVDRATRWEEGKVLLLRAASLLERSSQEIEKLQDQLAQTRLMVAARDREISHLREDIDVFFRENPLPDFSDPVVVHANMLRGVIARPTLDHIIHIYGMDALFKALVNRSTEAR